VVATVAGPADSAYFTMTKSKASERRPLVFNNGTERKIDQGFHAAVEIGPRDEAVLSKNCEELVKEIKASNEQKAADAVLALSYLNDSIAVPYLISALFSRRQIEPIIIEGLGRIGSQRAIDSLVEIYRFQRYRDERIGRSCII
jgi:hypothetical protein